jgi:hypothetical protein
MKNYVEEQVHENSLYWSECMKISNICTSTRYAARGRNTGGSPSTERIVEE